MDASTHASIETLAGVGLSLADTALAAGIAPDALNEELARNPELARDVLRRRVELKRDCLEKLIAAKQWQAAKFLLETLWPRQFGKARKRKPAKPAGPSDAERMAKLDDAELAQLRVLMHKMDGPPNVGPIPEPAPQTRQR